MDMSFRPQQAAPIFIPNIIQQKSFREAAESYVTHGGEGRYLGRILEYFGDRYLSEIHPFDIRKMTEELYPEAQGSTKNRQALGPARGYDPRL